jgi:hypothetical protein
MEFDFEIESTLGEKALENRQAPPRLQGILTRQRQQAARSPRKLRFGETP